MKSFNDIPEDVLRAMEIPDDRVRHEPARPAPRPMRGSLDAYAGRLAGEVLSALSEEKWARAC